MKLNLFSILSIIGDNMKIPRAYISYYLAAVVIISMWFIKIGWALTATGEMFKVGAGGALIGCGLIRIIDSATITVREIHREITA